MEDAVRLAGRKLKTALLCHSKPLATHLREKLSKADTNVGVWSLMELCVELTSKAGAPFTEAAGNEKGIESLLLAVRTDPSLRFDAIIVDEAQDFRTHWWIALEEILKDEAALTCGLSLTLSTGRTLQSQRTCAGDRRPVRGLSPSHFI